MNKLTKPIALFACLALVLGMLPGPAAAADTVSGADLRAGVVQRVDDIMNVEWSLESRISKSITGDDLAAFQAGGILPTTYFEYVRLHFSYRGVMVESEPATLEEFAAMAKPEYSVIDGIGHNIYTVAEQKGMDINSFLTDITTFSLIVIFLQKGNHSHALPDRIITYRSIIFREEVRVHAQHLCLTVIRRPRILHEQRPVFQDSVKMSIQGADSHRHGKFRGRADIGSDPQSLWSILHRQFTCKFKYAELPADPDILLYIGSRYLGRTLRKILQHLFCLDGDLVKVCSGMFSQKCGSVRRYPKTLCLIEHRYPFRHLIIPQRLRIHHNTHLRHGLV